MTLHRLNRTHTVGLMMVLAGASVGSFLPVTPSHSADAFVATQTPSVEADRQYLISLKIYRELLETNRLLSEIYDRASKP